MKELNLKSQDWSEYKSYRYVSNDASRLVIFDPQLDYVTTVDTTEEADNLVDLIEDLRSQIQILTQSDAWHDGNDVVSRKVDTIREQILALYEADL